MKMFQSFTSPQRPERHIVPLSGHTAWLTSFTASAMAFLTVFALSLCLSAGTLANLWSKSLVHTATIQLSATTQQMDEKTQKIMAILATTPHIGPARLLNDQEQRALLAPWFGPNMPLDALPVPRQIVLDQTGDGFDPKGLELRLAAEVPEAVFSDHTRWQRPLAAAAQKFRLIGLGAIILIAGSMAAMVSLAAHAALAANAQIIDVLRLIGATDRFIIAVFVKRFTWRAFYGAAFGTVAGVLVLLLAQINIALSPDFWINFQFQGRQWVWVALIPLCSACFAFWATRRTALSKLKELG